MERLSDEALKPEIAASLEMDTGDVYVAAVTWTWEHVTIAVSPIYYVWKSNWQYQLGGGGLGALQLPLALFYLNNAWREAPQAAVTILGVGHLC